MLNKKFKKMTKKKFLDLINQVKGLFIDGLGAEWSVDPAIRNFSISNAGSKVLSPSRLV